VVNIHKITASHLSKEGNCAIFNNMDESEGYYAKFCKPNTEQIYTA
jgi:hypothetical protein